MHRCAGDFHTVIQSGLVYPQSVEALAAEAGDQTGMDIEDPLGVGGGEILRKDGHKTGQNDHFDAVVGQHFLQLFFKSRLGAAFLFQHRFGGDAGLLCPFQGIGTGGIGYHQSDLTGMQHTSLGIDQCLQVGAAAGDQNRDFGFHSRITFSSFSMMEPMT